MDNQNTLKIEVLNLINQHPYLAELIRTSRDGDLLLNEESELCNPVFQDFLKTHKKKDLIQLCQSCNNNHLIIFWRWVYLSFDLTILLNKQPKYISIGGQLIPPTKILSGESLDSYFYWQDPINGTYGYYLLEKRDEIKNSWEHCNHDNFIQLYGRLTFLKRRYQEYLTYLYNFHIQEQRRLRSEAWDDYMVHFTLDHLLYRNIKGQTFSAKFDKIFFNNNWREIQVFLSHQRTLGVNIKIDDVAAFLTRQRKHYIQLASTISLEENSFLNTSSHKLFYDNETGIVKMPKLTQIQYLEIHNELKSEAGMIKMDGCPFAKSRGVSKNAIQEVYKHFDDLMLEAIELWLNSRQVA